MRQSASTPRYSAIQMKPCVGSRRTTYFAALLTVGVRGVPACFFLNQSAASKERRTCGHALASVHICKVGVSSS